MKNSELLPCPFCGGEARMVVLTSYPPKYQVEHACEVVCAKPAETPEQAIAAWNTRAETKAERDMRDEVNWMHAELHGAEMKRTCQIKNTTDICNSDFYSTAKCSKCMANYAIDFRYLKFCPNCGAKVVEE